MSQVQVKEADSSYLAYFDFRNSPFDFEYEVSKKILSIINSSKTPESKREELYGMLEQCNNIKDNINYALNNMPSNIIEFNSIKNRVVGSKENNTYEVNGDRVNKEYQIDINNDLKEDVLNNIKLDSFIKSSNFYDEYIVSDSQTQDLTFKIKKDIVSLRENTNNFYNSYDSKSIDKEGINILNQVQDNQIKTLSAYINDYKKILFEQHKQIKQIKQLKKYIIEKSNNEEVDSMNEDMKIILERLDKIDDKLSNKIDVLSDKINSIDKRISVNETILKNLEINQKEIVNNVKDLPILRKDVTASMEKSKWWKQYLLSPIITGIIVGFIVMLLNKVYK